MRTAMEGDMAAARLIPFGLLIAALAAGCTGVPPAPADPGREALIVLDNAGAPFAEDISRGAAVGADTGALGGARIGGLIAAAVGQRDNPYLASLQRQSRDQQGLYRLLADDLERETQHIDRVLAAIDALAETRLAQAGPPGARAAALGGDAAVARAVAERVRQRGDEFDAAILALLPASTPPTWRPRAGRIVGAAPLRLGPGGGVLGALPTGTSVVLRGRDGGQVLVETETGLLGFVDPVNLSSSGGIEPAQPWDLGLPGRRGEPREQRAEGARLQIVAATYRARRAALIDRVLVYERLPRAPAFGAGS